ncbi:hypothetical protein [Rhizobium sullae]|uniref:Uncharacterized protein n=1 Tax=Rhizobium sullae TaxID=50338 RepID=A0A2N0DCX1_RHISU|nr:hypothetical protein [Rhizobium sullae]PKA43944.1 hypothetical protein CWR43_06425 [Rhizobium sullae]TCU18402.1 hypothetical protein EV132_103525 [Rhizobium sullae]UWU14183.1 hypothetical protein N2599_19040 [Rhizobium sullae]
MDQKKTVQAKQALNFDDGVGDYAIDMLNTLIAQSRSARQPMLTYLLSMALIEAHRVNVDHAPVTHEAGLSLN